MCHIRLAIHEAQRVPQARGFYDTLEESLNIVIKARGKFYSYIQGQHYSVDLDRRGRLLGIEIFLPRKEWIVKSDLMISNDCPPRQISILEHRLEVEPLGIFTTHNRNICRLAFTEEKISYKYRVAQNVIFEVNVLDELSAIWMLNLEDDFGFKKEMDFRKGISPS